MSQIAYNKIYAGEANACRCVDETTIPLKIPRAVRSFAMIELIALFGA